MDTQNFVEYELVNPATDRRYFTESRAEALGYFEKGWLVFENQISVFRPSLYTATKTVVTMLWNDNPEFGEQ